MSTAIRDSDVNAVAHQAGLTQEQKQLPYVAASMAMAMEAMPPTLDELHVGGYGMDA